MTAKRITLATIKSFIRKNAEELYFLESYRFDGMIDCVASTGQTEPKLVGPVTLDNEDYGLGVPGAWFVGQSRDYFRPFKNDKFEGFEVYNSCGTFYLLKKL